VHRNTKLGFLTSLHLALFALITKPAESGDTAVTTLLGTFSFGVFAITLLAALDWHAPQVVVQNDAHGEADHEQRGDDH
jgi:hypothetical protein